MYNYVILTYIFVCSQALVNLVKEQTFAAEQARQDFMAERQDFMPPAMPPVPELQDGAGPATASAIEHETVQPGAPGAFKSCPTLPLNKLQ